MEPSPSTFSYAGGVEVWVQDFLTSRPHLVAESLAIAEKSGTDDLWLRIKSLVEFWDWTRRHGYISGQEARHKITETRQLAAELGLLPQAALPQRTSRRLRDPQTPEPTL